MGPSWSWSNLFLIWYGRRDLRLENHRLYCDREKLSGVNKSEYTTYLAIFLATKPSCKNGSLRDTIYRTNCYMSEEISSRRENISSLNHHTVWVIFREKYVLGWKCVITSEKYSSQCRLSHEGDFTTLCYLAWKTRGWNNEFWWCIGWIRKYFTKIIRPNSSDYMVTGMKKECVDYTEGYITLNLFDFR